MRVDGTGFSGSAVERTNPECKPMFTVFCVSTHSYNTLRISVVPRTEGGVTSLLEVGEWERGRGREGGRCPRLGREVGEREHASIAQKVRKKLSILGDGTPLSANVPAKLPSSVMTITMTNEAVDQIETVASNEEVNLNETLLRVAVVPGGCSGLTYDLGWETTVQDEDTVEEHDGVTVVLDKKSRLYLDGSELHFTDGLDGDGFHFSNPQASRECACGESFGV